MSTTVTKQKLLEAVAAHKCGRSAWSRGVKAYAVELVESLDDDADLSNEVMLAKALLSIPHLSRLSSPGEQSRSAMSAS